MKVQIEVTREDLDLGIMCSIHRCPVARAISRSLAGYWEVGVFTVVCRDVNRNYLYGTDLPPKAANFIKAFDGLHEKDRGKLAPISFELSVPDSAQKKGEW